MPPDSTGPLNILFDRSQWTITNIGQLIAALIGSVVALYSFPQLAPHIIALFGVGLFTYLLLKRWRIKRERPNEFSAKKSFGKRRATIFRRTVRRLTLLNVTLLPTRKQ